LVLNKKVVFLFPLNKNKNIKNLKKEFILGVIKGFLSTILNIPKETTVLVFPDNTMQHTSHSAEFPGHVAGVFQNVYRRKNSIG